MAQRPAVATPKVIAVGTGSLFVAGGILIALAFLLGPHGYLSPIASVGGVVVAAGVGIVIYGSRLPPWFYQALMIIGNLTLAPLVIVVHAHAESVGLAMLYVPGCLLTVVVFSLRTAALNMICFMIVASAALVGNGVPAAATGMVLSCGVIVSLMGGWLSRAAAVAELDSLTGLANRRGMEHAMAAALAEAEQDGTPLALVSFDLDDFKFVNDNDGHAAGDRLLETVARQWQASLRRGQTLVRMGGDEFALILPGCTTERAVILADQLRQLAFSAVGVNCSAGVAQWQPGDSVSLLMGRSDSALYIAKNRGRNQTAHSDSDDRERDELLRALSANEFEVFYQPIVAMSTGEQTGAEALIRWRHPERGLVPPLDFIPAAERTGAIGALGNFVLIHACFAAAEKIRSSGKPFRVSVNASGLELVEPGYPERLRSALHDSGLPAAALVIEVTESTLDGDQEQVLTALHGLRRLGVGVAIDDFGTGYSTLSRLDRLPANILKVDQSFVKAIGTTRPDNAILVAIVSLGRTLGMETLAEGIETREQADTLRGLGFRSGQGYLYGRPEPLAESALTASVG